MRESHCDNRFLRGRVGEHLDALWRHRSRHRRQRRYVYGGYSFAPDSLRYYDPQSSTSADWALRWDEGHERLVTRERYHSLESQTAVFLRDSLTWVVTAGRLPLALDTFPELSPVLALGRVEELDVTLVPAWVDRSSLRGVVRSSATVVEADLASLEVIGEGVVGRARTGVRAPVLVDGFGVSAPALVDLRFEADEMTVEEALLPSLTRPPEGEVGIYWEVYGASGTDAVEVELSVEPVGEPGFFGRVFGAIGLRSQPSALNLSWTEATRPEEGIHRRFFSLDASSVPEGDVRLTLSVEHPDGQRVIATTLFRVPG